MTGHIGKFEILSELGQGAMGKVYRARDPILERLVALKTVAPGLLSSPDAVARFQREARAAARLQHPNIVTIYELGEVEGTHFIAMELIEGRELGQVMAASDRFTVPQKVRIVADVCRGLEAGHRIALFAHPLEAPLLAEIRLQARPQGQQVLDIGRRVGLLPRGEGAARPVVLLAVLAQDRAQLGLRHRLQADLGHSQVARGDHGVEEAREGEAEVALQRGHVVVGPVQDLDHAGVGHDRREGREVPQGQGVDEPALAAVGGELHEAHLLEVVVQAVRLRVEGKGAAALEGVGQGLELFGGSDPAGHRA